MPLPYCAKHDKLRSAHAKPFISACRRSGCPFCVARAVALRSLLPRPGALHGGRGQLAGRQAGCRDLCAAGGSSCLGLAAGDQAFGPGPATILSRSFRACRVPSSAPLRCAPIAAAALAATGHRGRRRCNRPAAHPPATAACESDAVVSRPRSSAPLQRRAPPRSPRHTRRALACLQRTACRVAVAARSASTRSLAGGWPRRTVAL